MANLINAEYNKTRVVIIDPELSKLQNVMLFPEKVAKANEAIVLLELPKVSKNILSR